MKNILFVAMAVCCGVLVGYPARGQDTNKITENINLITVPVGRVLDLYRDLAKAQLIVASNVNDTRHTITLHANAASPEAARQMIEEALLKQAGIIVTRLDDKRISVTYNDQLRLQP